MVASPAETAAMARAIALAARGLGATSPNPVVGCVILDAAGEPVGEGWHERAGGPHAEVVALRAAGAAARGGTAVVTLEPCAHTGRTGPCTRELRAAGVRRVVYAVADPTPAGGGGARSIVAAGIEIEAGTLAVEAARGNEAWLQAARLGRPFVTWKYAASLDGRIAAADGTSRWVTGPVARADVHRLRATVDAVLVGVGTVLADDPALTVRAPDGTPSGRQPLRVVADRHGRTPPRARMLDGTAPGLVAADPDPPALLARLHARGVRHVLLEGGATLAAAFVRGGLVDRIVGYVAPVVLGAGPAVVGDIAVGTITGAVRFRLDEVTTMGADLRLVARPIREEGRQP